MTIPDLMPRYREIAVLLLAGSSQKEIVAEIGTNYNALGASLFRMRRLFKVTSTEDLIERLRLLPDAALAPRKRKCGRTPQGYRVDNPKPIKLSETHAGCAHSLMRTSLKVPPAARHRTLFSRVTLGPARQQK